MPQLDNMEIEIYLILIIIIINEIIKMFINCFSSLTRLVNLSCMNKYDLTILHIDSIFIQISKWKSEI